MMLGCSKGDGAVEWPRPVDEPDMLVGIVNPVNIQETRGDQCARPGLSGRRPLADQLNFQAALLAGFAQRRHFRVLIQLNVSPKWQPFIELPMMNEQNLPVP